MPTEVDPTKLIEDLREQNAELADQNIFLQNEVDMLKPIAEFRAKCRWFVRDCLHWKWVIILIGVEVLRLYLDAQHSQQLRNEVQDVFGLIDNLLDAVAPGAPRG